MYFNSPAPFQVRLDYILSARSRANPRLADELHSPKELGCGLPIILSYINLDFTVPRVITCASNYIAIFDWLRLL
jgi:hypothetical protein